MSAQKKKAASETEKVETPKMPNVAYPLKPRGNVTNLSQQYFNHLAGDESARFLFNNSGLWHQGIHLRASKFPSSEFENDKICAIADGKLIAYKVDSGYKTDNESESSKERAVYSTGFFLLKHEVAYPKDNVLTFYSLYRHTAKLGDYQSLGEELLAQTKSADKYPVAIREDNKVIAQLTDGQVLLIRKYHGNKSKFDDVVWYKDINGFEHKPKAGKHWKVFNRSYETMMVQPINGIPLLTHHKIETQTDREVKLDKPIEIKAGEELGLMGEYNQIGERGEKLLHLEVFTYDDIEQFKAKAEAAYKQDKEKKGVKANFLYVARGSQLYSIANDEAVALEKTQVEIMVPLADVAKQTVKDKQNPKKTKAYYNVQPYLYSLPHKPQEGGIYVDEHHLTHGLLFPGVNIFNQSGNGLCIFKHPLHQNIDPQSDLTIEQKNELDPMFKSIMDELDLEKDKNAAVSFEAGKLKDLLLSPVQQRRLTGIVAKHDSEWKKTRAADFSQTCGVYRANGKEEIAKRIEKRVEDLSIKLEVDGFNTDKQAYYLHPLGMIGWLSMSSKKLIDRDYFFEQYNKRFDKLTNAQKDALENIFTGIEEYIEADSSYICTLPKIAYMLATAKHETGHTFEPITEKGKISYFNRYDPILADTERRRAVAKANGNISEGDGFKYRGRGYVQLTWYNNYKQAGSYLGKDLVNNPELALDQKDATKIMIYGMETGMFTGKKMSGYISDSKKDYLNARRIINGMGDEHNFKVAKDIELYAYKLEECLRWL
jgi:glycoside hydrolase, family 19, putative